MFYSRPLSVLIFFVFLSAGWFEVSAQSIKTQQGAVLKRGGTVRISGALVQNKRSNFAVTSNQLGYFSILAAPGDTIEVAATGYTSQSMVVTDFKDVILYLIPVTELHEVIVMGKSLENELKEVQDGYRSKGVYYNGKPPVLASIFHPLMAINELFGKNAKRARRFSAYAENELEYQEIVRRFSDQVIKNSVPITIEELPVFKSEYLPTADQIRKWNDYDLVTYIKASFAEFRDKNKQKESDQK